MAREPERFGFEKRLLKGLGLLLLMPFTALAGRAMATSTTCEAIQHSDGDGRPDFRCGEMPLPRVRPALACESFTRTDKGEDPNPPTIILAENHTQTSTTMQCIEKLTANVPHTIYLEKVALNQEVPCKKHGLKNKAGRKCKGWDDPKAASAFANMLSPAGAFKHTIKGFKEFYSTSPMPDKQRDQFVKHQLTKSGPHHDGTSALKWLLAQREKGHSYEHILSIEFSKKMAKDGTVDLTAARRHNKLRNKSFITTLNQDNPSKELRVFVGGYGHFTPVPGDMAASDYMQRELAKAKAGNPYALLLTEHATNSPNA